MNKEYTENTEKYKQLSAEERGKIEVYRSLNCSISKIAVLIKRSKSTVCEEIRRGKYNGKYTARIAQNKAEKRRRESHKHSKWKNSELLNFIERHLKIRWSPEIISHELSENGIKFNHTSIYTVIKQHRPEWRKWLVHRGKKVRHKASTDKILNRVSIEKRPEIVDLRRRFGDWEADTVVSCRGGKSCLDCVIKRRIFQG
jgi:IS30 family transposase